ncbi:MAG: hypothetical protein JW819_05035 [Candidatus Krumholzibacteriota bacterium]|nr:hypothetical protein [Candidatus Krumholzibacteriota bacterium]
MKSPWLSRLDFQLAYLAALTRQGLKPLSRWEGRLGPEALDLIRAHDLVLDTVERRTRIGRRRIEVLFARDRRYVDLYKRRFDGAPIRHTPDAVRLEGRLFGYPSCCVESFIREPYAANGLPPTDQEILFHWACAGCKTTPRLVEEYRRVHAECRRRLAAEAPAPRHPARVWAGAAGRIAASLALVAGTAGVAAADDPHWLPVADDVDSDYLSFAEEVLRGTDWWNSDTDQNLVLDGVQTAQLLYALIMSPPPGVTVEDNMMWGLEVCSVCGESVNMGFVRISHAQRGLTVDVPYIALHYLEHGCLSYDGDLHTGRVDLDTLKRILVPYDPAHLLDWYEMDTDGDYLADGEEQLAGTDMLVPDTDGDSVEDGVQYAEELLPIIGELPRTVQTDRPYMLEMQMDGVEQCEVCGITLNMGGVEVVNPIEGLSLYVPYVGLHTLAHGGYRYDGSYNNWRIYPVALKTMLTGDGTSHWLPVEGDTDGDGMTDAEELAMAMQPGDPDENGDGVPDGRALAMRLASRINALPEGPLPDQTYVIGYYALGFYTCFNCGEDINMGHYEVVDPVAGRMTTVPFYNLHFMEKGSFSTDREDIYSRLDPRTIAEVLGETTGVPAQPVEFAFWNAPNPFPASGTTTIVLALPAEAGPVDVAIFDARGRKVRDLFAGTMPERTARFLWDGRDAAGESVAAGVYLCKVQMGRVSLARKITLVK